MTNWPRFLIFIFWLHNLIMAIKQAADLEVVTTESSLNANLRW